MTPAELQLWRKDQQLTQAGLAELLGVDRNTVARWEMGLHPIPRMLELALWAIREQRKKP